MARDFRYPTPDTDVWVPRSVSSIEEIGPNVRNQRFLDVVGRLRDTTTPGEARAALNAVAGRLAAQHPDTNAGWNGIDVVPLRTAITGDVDQALMFVTAIVSAIFALVCLNLANMLIARGGHRLDEIAVRVSLGASRARILRQMLTESMVLASLGGVIGLGVSALVVRAVILLGASTLPRMEDVRIDPGVIGMTLLLTLVAGCAFGVLPALHAWSQLRHKAIVDGRAVAGHGQSAQRRLLVAQLAVAVVLLFAASLMTRSFLALRSADPGFRADGALAITMQMNVSGVEQPVPHIVQRRQEWIDRVATLPGVVGVGTITSLPLQDRCGDYVEFLRVGRDLGEQDARRADECLISSGYFGAMGIPLLRGTSVPDIVAPPPAAVPFVVSQTAARRFWPGEDPLGKTVRLRRGLGRDAVVVGVVGDVRQVGLREEPTATVYFPQATGPRLVTTLVVRTAGDPRAFAGPIREAIRSLDANQAIRSITTLGGVMVESVARDRFFTFLFGAFAGIALVIAAVGVYGVFANAVIQRRREIGVRMAVGASPSAVMAMVLGQGGRLIAAGLILGVAGALLVSSRIETLLYRTSAHDLPTLVVVPTVLVVVALTACAIPAWRAARVDPLLALRPE